MAKTPFKMKGFSGFGNSPMTKKSPAKDDPHTTTEKHAAHETEEPKGPPVGTINDASTKVWDGTNWAGVGDRSDLASPNQVKANKERLAKIKVPKM